MRGHSGNDEKRIASIFAAISSIFFVWALGDVQTITSNIFYIITGFFGMFFVTKKFKFIR